jgi:hypothetical protein
MKNNPLLKSIIAIAILSITISLSGNNSSDGSVKSILQYSTPDSAFLIKSIKGIPGIYKQDEKEYQNLLLNYHFTGDPSEIVIKISENQDIHGTLNNGDGELEIPILAVKEKKNLILEIDLKKENLATIECIAEPVPRMTIYILPHSHTDIGYTEIQTAIETKQVNNLIKGIEFAKKTAEYPVGSRFVWNVEVLWAADLYLQRLSDTQREDFLLAVKSGQVALNGMYLNVLTGLCRPEELQQLFRYSTQLAEKCGITIDAAMTSDIPGQTWGTVTVMNQAGIKYFSTAPNYFDRIGDILVKWENKPFYWVSPSGKEKVLVWIPLKGYAMSHIVKKLSADWVESYFTELEKQNYPYDITHIRWSGQGDNAEPDMEICEFVKSWNTKYEWPRFIISSTSEAFHAFEEKYGKDLPRLKGDWTPYWEDGAGSSAFETGINRSSSSRISQSEALWAIQNPGPFPTKDFEEAWKKVLLYSEHTWGAWCSVSDPENKMTKEQWEIKQGYALQADSLSKELLVKAFNATGKNMIRNSIDVFNTSSWKRTNLVLISAEQSNAGDRVSDMLGNPVPSQRLKNGKLAFIAAEIEPYSSSRFTISSDKAWSQGKIAFSTTSLDNGLIRIKIDPLKGNIIELETNGSKNNYIDTASGFSCNEFIYLPGDKIQDIRRSGKAKIRIGEAGPLVASIIIESDAPSCNKLTREIRMVEGFDYVEITNSIDKKRAETSDKPDDWNFAQKGGKESLNFAFPFNVKNGIMRLDVPFGLMEPEKDQIPSACKNWLTIGSWADVSNNETGISWVSIDAPLVEAGGLTANLPGSQSKPEVWRKKIEPSQTLFSWIMNNHWGTNYRAWQEGIITFRYALKPHQKFNPAYSNRFAIEQTQPLLVMRSKGPETAKSCFAIENENIVVTSFKPGDEGNSWIINLFNSSDKSQTSPIRFDRQAPKGIWSSNTSEKALSKIAGDITIDAWDVMTIRVEF